MIGSGQKKNSERMDYEKKKKIKKVNEKRERMVKIERKEK